MDRLSYQPGVMIPGTVYRVVRHIGAGGMGTVYDVEDTTVGKRYVLKALHAELSSRRDLAKRMEAEARTLARLSHPNIVEVVTAGATTDDLRLPYYVMEKLNGQNLRTILSKKGSLDLPHALHIAIDLLDALDNAHDKGVIHRDVKPDNIFLHRSVNGVTMTKLLDFGIMRLLDAGPGATAGRFMGTLRYAAAEQLRGEPLSPQTDLYAAALVLYEMVAGSGPFDDLVDPNKIAAAHIQSAPPPLLRWGVVVPESLEKLLRSALAKEPSRRPRDAFTFAAQLRNLKRTLQAERVSDSESSRPTEVPVVGVVTGTAGSLSALPLVSSSGNFPPGSESGVSRDSREAYATTQHANTRAGTPAAKTPGSAGAPVALPDTRAGMSVPSVTGGTLMNASSVGRMAASEAQSTGTSGTGLTTRGEESLSGGLVFDRNASTHSVAPEIPFAYAGEGTEPLGLVSAVSTDAATTEPWQPQNTLRMDVQARAQQAGTMGPDGGERVSDLLGLLPTNESIVARSDAAASRTIVPMRSPRHPAIAIAVGLAATGAVVATLALIVSGVRRHASPPEGAARGAAGAPAAAPPATAPFEAPTLAPPLDTEPSPAASAPAGFASGHPLPVPEVPAVPSSTRSSNAVEPPLPLRARTDGSRAAPPRAEPRADPDDSPIQPSPVAAPPARPAHKRKLPGSGL